jgi:selenocysteine lyase/cysteine desulfurase
VGFVANTSTAMTWAALILEGAGGAVLAAAEEHPTVVTPWLARGFRVDVAPPDGSGAFTAESYARCLRPDTKIIAVSHVRFNDGQINEIEKLAELIHFRGGYLVVDASQSAGVLPVHATSGADIIGFAGFKWLNAGSGTGAIYVRQALLERFGMPIGGNRSRKTQDLIQIDRFEPLLEAKALELGSLAVPNILALGASLDLIESIGSTAIQARIIELTRRLQIGLKENHIVIAGVESDGSPIISVSVVDPPAAMRALERRNIAVSLRSGRLRIAVSWYNNEADIDTCLNAMTDGPNLGRGP